MGKKRNLLIYCLNVHGHRQVYCNVLTEWALGASFFVFIVYAGKRVFIDSKMKMLPFGAQYIEYYKGNEDVKLINILDIFNNININEEFKVIADLKRIKY